MTRRLLAIAILALALATAGCSSTADSEPPAAAPAGGMGGGMGGSGGAMDAMSGVVAAADSASITIGPNASTPTGVLVESVIAPADGWVVVHSAAPPGIVLGTAPVRKGKNTDVAVKLTSVDAAVVDIVLHVDKGTKDAFDYDPDRPELSLDKPVVAGGVPIRQQIPLTAFGVEALANAALMRVEDQSVVNDTIVIDYLLLPGAAWVSVNRVEDGLLGESVGTQFRPAGESQEVQVPVKGVTPGEYAVTIIADRGQPGVLEFNPADQFASVDQPYKSAGVIVGDTISIK